MGTNRFRSAALSLRFLAYVLLITPESIESLMINRSTSLARMFRFLQFVVIDEIRALVGSERGTHLRSLLFRLGRYVHDNYRIVGLSATLGDAFPVYALLASSMKGITAPTKPPVISERSIHW